MSTSRRLATLTATAVAAGLLLPTTSVAATPTVSDIEKLAAALSTCTDGDLVTVTADITAPEAGLVAACTLSVDLAGQDVDVRRLAIAAGETVTITDTGDPSSAGTLTADAGSTDQEAGIRTTGAGLVVAGAAHVVATGSPFAAGIGGDNFGHGGDVTTSDRAVVTAIGGSAGGAGIGGGSFGSGGSLTTRGSSIVTATGGSGSAGVGGGPAGAGGDVHLVGSSTVEATGGYSAIGSGEQASGNTVPPFGSLHVESGTLRLPSGRLVLADSNPLGPEVIVGVDGVVSGSITDPASSAMIVGHRVPGMGWTGGRITNNGAIRLPQAAVAPEIDITGNHHEVTYQPNGGSSPTVAARTWATSLAAGAREIPAPVRAGYAVIGWNSAPDGSGTDLTADTELPGTSSDGTPVGHTFYAQWGPAAGASLVDELGSCTDGDTVVVGGDIDELVLSLDVSCSATLDLAGHDVSIRVTHINPTETLTVTDSTVDPDEVGTLTSGDGSMYGAAGIRATDATLVVDGTAHVVARGGPLAAGVGGDDGDSGGTVEVDGGSLTATGGATAIGAGQGGAWFGLLEVTAGTLTLPSGQLVVPDSRRTAEVTVGPAGTIAGSAHIVPSSSSGGEIDNDGTISVPLDSIEVPVLGNHYEVTFDLDGGTGEQPDPVTVLARTLATGGHTMPADPSREAHDFEGWSVRADTDLRAAGGGGSTDGTAVPVAAVAEWEHLAVTVPAPDLVNTTSPTRGLTRATVGDTLSASVGVTAPADAAVSWTWRRDSGDGPTDIPGAGGATYRLAAADVGAMITAVATAARDPWLTTDRASRATAPVALRTFPTIAVDLIGDPVVGSPLTAELSPAAEPGATVSWRWQRLADRTATDIAGATGATYTPTTTDVGHRLRLIATTEAPGHQTATTTATSAAVTAAILPTPAVSVAGTPRDGSVLRAQVANAAAPTTYTWLANGKPLRGAAYATLELRPAQIGKRITVRAVGVTSAPTAVVQAAAKPYVDLSAAQVAARQQLTVYGHGPKAAVRYLVVLGTGKASGRLDRTDSFTQALRVPRGVCGRHQVRVTFLDRKGATVKVLTRAMRITGC